MQMPRQEILISTFVIALVVVPWLSSNQVVAGQEPTEIQADAALTAEPEEEASDEAETATPLAALRTDTDILWTCIAAFLVFFMQAGFAMVEAGFTRAKNACNILMKNLMDFSIGSLAFWAIGFALMFGVSWKGLIGTSGFFYEAPTNGDWAFLIFQTVFAATAATIVSGAMAERTKFVGYLAYSVGITVLVYPIFGSWAWNGLVSGNAGGWLEGLGWGAAGDQGFLDFAGSTVVHSVGGWAALAGALVLGPRIGKYVKGKTMPIPGHNIPLAALGVFILWLGWFGFNPGSTTSVADGAFASIAVMTNLAAAAGAVGAMVVSWMMFKKPDTSFALNGALAGLVAITAGCDIMTAPMSVLTGLIAGVIVVLSVVMFDKLRIDDPVGAISVHGVCGAWGTLAIGLWATDVGLFMGGGTTQLAVQAVGVAAAFAWAFPVSLVIFLAIKATIGLRVSEEEERAGLDVVEHGMAAYPPGLLVDHPAGSPLPYVPAAAPAPAPATVGGPEGAQA